MNSRRHLAVSLWQRGGGSADFFPEKKLSDIRDESLARLPGKKLRLSLSRRNEATKSASCYLSLFPVFHCIALSAAIADRTMCSSTTILSVRLYVVRTKAFFYKTKGRGWKKSFETPEIRISRLIVSNFNLTWRWQWLQFTAYIRRWWKMCISDLWTERKRERSRSGIFAR